MEQKVDLQYRSALQWGELDPQRRKRTPVGMWAWICQRISAIAIVFLLGLHIALTYKPLIQFLLLVVVMFHGVLGLRVILLDFNLIHVKYQKALIAGLTALGVVMVAIIWTSVYGL